MPQMFVHFLSLPLLLKIYSLITKKDFDRNTYLFAAFCGVVPDFDVIFVFLNYVIPMPTYLMHGYITHTFFFGVLFFLFCNKYTSLIGLGIITHVILDCVLGGGHQYGLMLLYPFSDTRYAIGLLKMFKVNILVYLDILVFFIWILYLHFTDKIKKIM